MHNALNEGVVDTHDEDDEDSDPEIIVMEPGPMLFLDHLRFFPKPMIILNFGSAQGHLGLEPDEGAATATGLHIILGSLHSPFDIFDSYTS